MCGETADNAAQVNSHTKEKDRASEADLYSLWIFLGVEGDGVVLLVSLRLLFRDGHFEVHESFRYDPDLYGKLSAAILFGF